MAACQVAFQRHETGQGLAFLVLQRNGADHIVIVARVDHDVIGGVATGEEIRECSRVGGGFGFGHVGDEGGPDGDELAEFEGVVFAREVELQLPLSLARIRARSRGRTEIAAALSLTMI